MKVIIVAATEKESLLMKQAVKAEFPNNENGLSISFFVTGVGILTSCFSISKVLNDQKPDLIIQAGIAGSFDTKAVLADVVIVRDEIMADTGVEENGTFKDLFDLGLANEDVFPFFNKRLVNPRIESLNFLRLRAVTGITINEITTSLQRIEQYRAKYDPVIETMEGASFHYCCLQAGVSFIQVRAISNYIGERDKSKWSFQNAFKNLSNTVMLHLEQLYKTSQH